MSNGVYKNPYLVVPRRPKNLNQKTHEIVDAWFYEQFGVYARSRTIFCSTDFEQAKSHRAGHGAIIKVTPTGEHKVIFSPAIDDLMLVEIEAPSLSADEIRHWLNSKNYRCLDNVRAVPSSFKGELMLYCSTYMATVIPNGMR